MDEPIFQILDKRMSRTYNSNFRIDRLDTCTKLALITLCKIIDEKLESIRSQNVKTID